MGFKIWYNYKKQKDLHINAQLNILNINIYTLNVQLNVRHFDC